MGEVSGVLLHVIPVLCAIQCAPLMCMASSPLQSNPLLEALTLFPSNSMFDCWGVLLPAQVSGAGSGQDAQNHTSATCGVTHCLWSGRPSDERVLFIDFKPFNLHELCNMIGLIQEVVISGASYIHTLYMQMAELLAVGQLTLFTWFRTTFNCLPLAMHSDRGFFLGSLMTEQSPCQY